MAGVISQIKALAVFNREKALLGGTSKVLKIDDD